MENEKGYKSVTVEACGEYKIRLIIELKHDTDREWQSCYQDAIAEKGTYISMRSSGAPTIDNVSFSFGSAITREFANNECTKNEAKEFLNEFNGVLLIANRKYENLQRQKEIEAKRKKEADKKQKEEIKKLNDFFNN